MKDKIRPTTGHEGTNRE